MERQSSDLSMRGLFGRNWAGRCGQRFRAFGSNGGDFTDRWLFYAIGWVIGLIATLAWGVILIPVRIGFWFFRGRKTGRSDSTDSIDAVSDE